MLDRDDFIEERRDPRQADADNEFDFDFVEYRRR
jgi:dihydrofolate reductase